MSHFAQIDENGIVLQVLVGNDSFPNEGHDWFVENLGGTWVKTSYNTRGNVHYGSDGEPDGGIPFRKNYAGKGSTYNETLDAFISESPYPSWVLDEETCRWEAPTPMPVFEGVSYLWDEDDLNWQVVESGE
jgi:hypothetical protein